MKTLLRLLIGLCLAAGAASASTEPAIVSFVVGRQEFKPGDGIVVEQVLATSPGFEVGTKVVVRGHYRLASAAMAKLGLVVSHRAPAGRDPTTQSQLALVDHGSGSFELSCAITYPGDLHVSFYPAAGGESIGTVYLAPANAAAEDLPAIKQSIIQHERAALEAFRTHDKNAYGRLCLPDFYEITSEGTVNSLPDELVELDDYVLGEYKMDDTVVTVVSDGTALIRYKITAQWRFKGKPLPLVPMLASAVWVRTGDDWKAATYEEVKAAPDR